MTIVEKYFSDFTPLQLRQIERLQGIYADWNSKINVISRKDTDNFYERHVLHSLAVTRTGLIHSGQTVLDVGCGGGFPVVPLAIAMPDVRFTAVDSIGKKIKVVEAVVDDIELKNVEAHNCRVEALDGQWDWVVSRAVAPTTDILRWTKGKYRKGLILLKGGDLTEEIAQCRLADDKVRVMSIGDWFEEEFFDTKSVVIIEV